MKVLISLIAVSAFLAFGFSAPARADGVTLKCVLLRAPDWRVTLSLENGEITSLVYANQSGTMVSAPITVSRSVQQDLPGFVIFDVHASTAYELIAQETLLTEHTGSFFYLPDSPELPPDEYACR